jgi:hypothetical protein
MRKQMNAAIETQLFEIVKQIKAWDPEEYNAEMLLRLCDEFDRIKDNPDISLADWTDIKQLGCAAEYKERVDRKVSYPIWACDFAGDCIVGTDEWYIEHIDDIEEKH